VTQKVIAEALNLSRGTVSLALSGSPLVNAATRERVLEMARRQRYRPNLAARSISTGKSMSIGIIFPSISHPFNAAVVDGLQTCLLSAGYVGLYYPSNGPDDWQKALDALIPRRVDGIIAVATTPEIISFLQREDIPSVFFGANRDGLDEVTHDEERSGWLAATHLSALGHTRIGFIGPADEVSGRFKGFRDALRSCGIALATDCIRSFVPGFGETSARQGYEAMKSLLNLPDRPTAIFAHNDQLAIGAMRAVYESRLSVPGDVSIIGHDDTYEGRYLPVSLTSVGLPTERIARELARLMLHKLSQLKDPHRKPLRVLVEPALVQRESTGGRR